MLQTLSRMTKKGIIVLMTSQCAYGKVNMNVYSAGRQLLQAGVVPVNMTAEAAFAKLGWALGARKKGVIDLIKEEIAGEFAKSDHRHFLS